MSALYVFLNVVYTQCRDRRHVFCHCDVFLTIHAQIHSNWSNWSLFQFCNWSLFQSLVRALFKPYHLLRITNDGHCPARTKCITGRGNNKQNIFEQYWFSEPGGVTFAAEMTSRSMFAGTVVFQAPAPSKP